MMLGMILGGIWDRRIRKLKQQWDELVNEQTDS